jgi:hypothetical protein
VLTEDMPLFAIPGARLEAFAERIAVLSKANSILSRFHRLRRADIEAGQRPSVEQAPDRVSAEN